MAVSNVRMQVGPTHKSKTPKISPRGRVCQTPGCSTVLSIYNDAPDCSMHEQRTVRSRTRRI